MNIDEQFDKLANEMISKAGKIKCSSKEYADGLHQMAEELLIAADAAEHEAERNNDNEDSSL